MRMRRMPYGIRVASKLKATTLKTMAAVPRMMARTKMLAKKMKLVTWKPLTLRNLMQRMRIKTGVKTGKMTRMQILRLPKMRRTTEKMTKRAARNHAGMVSSFTRREKALVPEVGKPADRQIKLITNAMSGPRAKPKVIAPMTYSMYCDLVEGSQVIPIHLIMMLLAIPAPETARETMISAGLWARSANA